MENINNFTRLNSPLEIYRYIFGGKGIFTLKSNKTGNHLTYRIIVKNMSTPSASRMMTFAFSRNNSIHNGADDRHKWTYMGTIEPNYTLRITQKSRFQKSNIEFIALNHFLGLLKQGQLHPQLQFYRSNTCGRCGRELTEPDSIILGFGPHCRGQLNDTKSVRQNQTIAKPIGVDIRDIHLHGRSKMYDAPMNPKDLGWTKCGDKEWVTEASDLGSRWINPYTGTDFLNSDYIRSEWQGEDKVSDIYIYNGTKFIILND